MRVREDLRVGIHVESEGEVYEDRICHDPTRHISHLWPIPGWGPIEPQDYKTCHLRMLLTKEFVDPIEDEGLDHGQKVQEGQPGRVDHNDVKTRDDLGVPDLYKEVRAHVKHLIVLLNSPSRPFLVACAFSVPAPLEPRKDNANKGSNMRRDYIDKHSEADSRPDYPIPLHREIRVLPLE